ncbi:winged helix-turn-helix domain-containing protein [Phytohabitans rumicis]|uniref:winged helix-turn-helix domain-containing protein n=1 Tax=Phytohabitans rumicis TaxID=1076125 RepID=UPI0031ED8C90
MTIVALPQRRHLFPAAPRPALTVTFTVPLSGDSLSPHAFRLLEVVRDLVEGGEGTIAIGAVPAEPVAVEDEHRIQIFVDSRTVLRGGEPLELTRLEFDLLLFLAQHPRRVFTRIQLLSSVWGYEHAVARTVDVHVRRLRAKVGETVPLVTTVYGVGYRLADDAQVELVGHVHDQPGRVL